MERRWLRLGLAPAALCLLGAGCVTPGQWLTGDAEPVSTAAARPLAAAPSPSPPGDLTPDQALQLCLTMARQMDKAGNDAGALENWEKVLKMDPNNASASRRLCVLYDRSCQFSKAEAEYRKLARANPKDADLYNDWGYSLYLRNNWDEAEGKLRTALQIDAKNTRAHCNLGLVLGQKGEVDEALRQFAAAGLTEAEARCNVAFALWSQGKIEPAREECRRAMQVDGSCARAREMLTQLDLPPRPKVEGPAARGGDKAASRRPEPRAYAGQDQSTPRAAGLSDAAWAAERVKAVKAAGDLYGPGAGDGSTAAAAVAAPAPAPVAATPVVVPPELKSLGWSPMIRPTGPTP